MRRSKALFYSALLILLTTPTFFLNPPAFQSGGNDLGYLEHVSVDSNGIQGNDLSEWPTISRNGRYIAYHSVASNLVPNDTNNSQDIFLYDRLTRDTTRISLGTNGVQANNRSQFADLTSDGRFAAFHSEATNLVPNDTNNSWDVFLRDTLTGQIERISMTSTNTQANGHSYFADISGDGRFITFASAATNLVPNDTNGVDDIFLFDTQTGTIERINTSNQGIQSNGFSTFPDISADGRYIVYESIASTIVPDDTNGVTDVFLYDTLNGTNQRISLSSNQQQGNGGTSYPVISDNNRYVTFVSHSTNFNINDPNSNGDIYLRDLTLDTITLISTGMNGQPTSGESHYPFLSANGRFIVYNSNSSNLVPGDTNNTDDIFLHDRQSGTTRRINLNEAGNEANGSSTNPAISATGQIMTFQSYASNLVPLDLNNTADIFLYFDLPYRSYLPAIYP